MEITASKWLKELANDRQDRTRVSVYVSESLYTEFKELCGDAVSPSRILERLMEEFIRDARESVSGIPPGIPE